VRPSPWLSLLLLLTGCRSPAATRPPTEAVTSAAGSAPATAIHRSNVDPAIAAGQALRSRRLRVPGRRKAGSFSSLALAADAKTLLVGAAWDSNVFPDGPVPVGHEASSPPSPDWLQAGAAYVFGLGPGGWQQPTLLKPQTLTVNEAFGKEVAISSDGSTLAVASARDRRNQRGELLNEDTHVASGAVRIFVRRGHEWPQAAYLKAPNADYEDQFFRLALSGDGHTLAVGAADEDSSARGVDGDMTNDASRDSGAVYVFAASLGGDATQWKKPTYIKASNGEAGDRFGHVALSFEGSTLAVGACGEDSAAAGIDGNRDDNSAPDSGAVYVFVRNARGWQEQAYVKVSDPLRNAPACDVAISADGNTLAVARTAVSPARDSRRMPAGAVYLFERKGQSWSQSARLESNDAAGGDAFGYSMALSQDGNTLAVGSRRWGTGKRIDFEPGEVHVFERDGGQWRRVRLVPAPKPEREVFFGQRLAFGRAGATLAVSAFEPARVAKGDAGGSWSFPAVGAIYLFE
jgi:hypothetical protein